jgi:sulfur carrier protein ThiS
MVTKIIFRKKEYLVKSGTTIKIAIEALGIVPESVLPTRKGQIMDEDEIIHDGEIVRLVPVITGG